MQKKKKERNESTLTDINGVDNILEFKMTIKLNHWNNTSLNQFQQNLHGARIYCKAILDFRLH